MMVTHPVYEAAYDCPKGQRIEGEMRYHGKGECSTCRTCLAYRDKYDR